MVENYDLENKFEIEIKSHGRGHVLKQYRLSIRDRECKYILIASGPLIGHDMQDTDCYRIKVAIVHTLEPMEHTRKFINPLNKISINNEAFSSVVEEGLEIGLV